MKYAIGSLLFVVGQFGCAPQPKAQLNASNADHTGFIGAGYASGLRQVTSRPAEPCVTANKLDFTAAPIALFKSELSRDYDYREDEFRVGVETGAGLKVRAEFLDGLRESSLSIALLTEFEYTYGTLHLRSPHLSSAAAALLNMTDRKTHCGDEFIEQIDVGASFLTALVFHFKERHKFLKVSVQVLLDLLFGSITLAEFSARTGNDDLQTTVDLKVLQTGGDQRAFAVEQAKLNLEQCGYIKTWSAKEHNPEGDLQKCLSAYNRAIDYAKTRFLEQLATAKRAPKTLAGIDGLVATGVRTRRYSEIGLWQFQPDSETLVPNLELQKKRDELATIEARYKGAQYSFAALQKDTAKGAASVFRLSAARVADLKASLYCAEESLARIAQAKKVCAEHATSDQKPCGAALDHIELLALPYLEQPVIQMEGWSLSACPITKGGQL